jgi:hypothetical protein
MIMSQKLFVLLIGLLFLLPCSSAANEIDSPPCKESCQIPSIFLDKAQPPATQPPVTQSAVDTATDAYHPTLAPIRLKYKPRGTAVELKVHATQIPTS